MLSATGIERVSVHHDQRSSIRVVDRLARCEAAGRCIDCNRGLERREAYAIHCKCPKTKTFPSKQGPGPGPGPGPFHGSS